MRFLPLTRPLAAAAGLILLSLAILPAVARAANQGQADLDKATELRVGAVTSSDLSDVIKLCDSALKQGLDKNNTAFANDLLASALAQRGGISAAKIFGDEGSPLPRLSLQGSAWKDYRDEALADLEKALKISPKQPQAQFTVARLNLLPGGNADKALQALDQAVALSDDDAAMKAKALLLRSSLRKTTRQRIGDLDEAIKLLPGNAMLLRAHGLAMAEDQSWEKSLADFDKSLAAEPDNLATYQLKAAVLAKLKKYPQALATLEKAHTLAPGNIELLAAKAEIYGIQLNYKAAVEELTRAIAVNGSNVDLLRRRAEVYERMGDSAKALADVDRMLELVPGNRELLRAAPGCWRTCTSSTRPSRNC